ncbi:MAG: hypothetical protein ABEI57_03060 [Halapricum sp.]
MFGTWSPTPSATHEPPDISFAAAVGLYVAALVAPAIVGLIDGVSDPGTAVLYMSFLAVSAVLVVGVGVAVGRVRGLAERLGSSRLSWGVPFLAALVGLGYGYVAFSTELISTAITFVGFATSLIAVLLGLLIQALAHSRYTAAILHDVSVTAEWHAGWPARDRWLTGIAGIALMLFGLVGFIADLLPGGIVVQLLGMIAYIVGTAIVGAGRPWTYRVTPEGLERALPVYRTLTPWEKLAGYETGERTLRLYWRSWWRPAIRCDLQAIDDPEAVFDALDDHLVRQ